MKKALVFLTVFSLFFTLFCCFVYADGNTVDIGLFYGNSAKSSVTITYSGTTVTVNAEDVADTAEYGSYGVTAVNGKEYRGSIILKKDSAGLLTVINRVDMEDYIASVISVEMSPSFNIEALKAQAVCARTYAMKNMVKHSSYGFDLCSSTDCQVYGGISSESETTNRAVAETAGIYMTYNGQVIDAVYSATSGGWTEDVKNVWGSDIPYLAAVEDPYESKDVYGSSWTKEISADEATNIMDRKGYNLGTVTDISVIENTERGVVTKLKVTGTNGEKIFTREGCRLAFGSVTLSQAFSVTPIYPVDTAENLIYVYDGSTVSGKVSVLSSEGVSEISLDGVTLKGEQTREYNVSYAGDATSFVFEGRGFGHLVGMSQNGANGMAGAGFTYEEILKHYYKGIELN